MAKKYKDNIIQFPTEHKPSSKARIQVLEARLSEIELENDMMRSDMDYLSGAINKNVSELQDILKELSMLAGLEKPIVEFKGEMDDMQIQFNFDQLDDFLNNELNPNDEDE